VWLRTAEPGAAFSSCARAALGPEEGHGLEARAPDRPTQRREARRGPALGCTSPSVAQNRQVELLNTCGVGNHVDLGDLAVRNRQIEDQLIGKLNGFLIWLNLVYLLAVSFMPFPTALLRRYPMQPIPIVIYGLNLIVANITMVSLWLFLWW
jgi:hypothetical protein